MRAPPHSPSQMFIIDVGVTDYRIGQCRFMRIFLDFRSMLVAKEDPLAIDVLFEYVAAAVFAQALRHAFPLVPDR